MGVFYLVKVLLFYFDKYVEKVDYTRATDDCTCTSQTMMGALSMLILLLDHWCS